MVRFGQKPASAGADWQAVTAEIRDTKYGLVHTTDSGIGGMYESHTASKKVTLQVEPAGAQPYEAVLKIERGGPAVPDVPGTRFQVLVDPSDPQHVALPSDPAFQLPGGGTWQPQHGLAGALAEAAQRGDAAEVARLSAEAHAAAPPITATPPAPTEDDTISQLEKLGQLHDSGVLTDDEFAAQKAKVVGQA